MEKNIILRENLKEFEKFIEVMAELYNNKIKEIEDTIVFNGITYNLTYTTDTNYKADDTVDTKTTLTVTTSDNRRVQFIIMYHKADWKNEFDTDRVDMSIQYKLPNNKVFEVIPSYLANHSEDLARFKIDSEDDSVYIGFGMVDCTIDLFPKKLHLNQQGNGILIRKEMYDEDNCARGFYFYVSGDGEKILSVNGRDLPSFEVIKNFNVERERSNYLSSIKEPLTKELLDKIIETYNEFEHTGFLYDQISDIYPEIINEIKDALARQKKYNEMFMQAFFSNAELELIRNAIMDEYNIELEDKFENTK